VHRERTIRIVCPLAAEAAVLGPLARRLGAELGRSGPGEAAMAAWCNASPPADLVVLAGIAGGLTAARPVGSALAASAVVDGCGTRWEARWNGLAAIAPTAVVTGSSTLVATPEGKRALALSTGAELVDMESSVFARWATTNGRAWLVVRGVSDGVDDALPDGLASLVAPDGRTRPLAVASLLLRRPSLVPSLGVLGARTKTAMRAVASLVDTLIDAYRTGTITFEDRGRSAGDP
jgi:hypothetical protein